MLRSGKVVEGTLFCLYQNNLTIFLQNKTAVIINEKNIKSIQGKEDRQCVFTRIRFKTARKRIESTPVPDGVQAPTESYWMKRYLLFSKYDEGILLDRESWFSVTPECIAAHVAKRLECGLILDLCTGAGGNAIQFALTCDRVIALDVDENKIVLAKNNAKIYGVDERIEFVVGDALTIMKGMNPGAVDVIFISPPWGGPGYQSSELFHVSTDIKLIGGGNGVDLFQEARRIANCVVLFLPRNLSKETLLSELGETFGEVETHILGNKEFTICAYFGSISE